MRRDRATRTRPGRQTVSADEARQGEIILRTPLRQAVFIAGLVAAVIVAIVIAHWSRG